MADNFSSKTKTKTVISIDGDTGECLGEEVTTESINYEKEPPFIKLYLSDIARINDVPKGMDKILFAFVKRMNYGDNIILAYKPIKQMIANELGIGLDYVDASIKLFKKKGILVSVARGIYMVDPELFGKGKWKDVKQLRLLVEYQADGTKRLTSSLSGKFENKVKEMTGTTGKKELPSIHQVTLEEEIERAIKKHDKH